MKKKIFYIVNARLPNKKAYGIQIAKMCEAFIEAGAELTLVIPNIRRPEGSMREFYNLRVDVPTVILPALDWYDRGRVRFFFASLVFMAQSFLYARRALRENPASIIYTIDMDTFSFAHLPLAGKAFAEMHEPKSGNWLARLFFRNARGIIATNTEIKRALLGTFSLPENTIIVEPNGVDLALFESAPARDEARTQLSLSKDQKIALYVGRFYAWKGLGVLVDAAQKKPEIDWYVLGDSRELFIEATGKFNLPQNLHVVGFREPEEIALWQAASDALLLLGTKENARSFYFTAPMKIYEYMASKRPIVASETPALTSLISKGSAAFYEPDNAGNLAEVVESVLQDTVKSSHMATNAYGMVREHTWAKRAERILSFISQA